MVAMLNEVGVKANYVLINAGASAHRLNDDFPSNQFNHATVCVPLAKDTLWLECTDQHMATAYISNFTGNRQAVLIDEKGGHLVNTTFYRAEDNLQSRRINAAIDAGGKLTADVFSKYHCLAQDDLQTMLHHQSKKEQLDELKTAFDIATYDILSADYKELPLAKPIIEENLQLTSEKYATVSGKRLFVLPNILTKQSYKLAPDNDRHDEVYLRYGQLQKDTIEITIPEGYSTESQPKNVDISNEFGEYSIHFEIEQNKLQCYRYFKRNEGSFPATGYNKLVNFYNEIYKADHTKAVFVKAD